MLINFIEFFRMCSKSSATAAAANMEWDINDSNIPKVHFSKES